MKEQQAEAVSAEVVGCEVDEQLSAIAKREGVAEQTQVVLLSSFAPFHAAIAKALAASKGVTDGEDPAQRRLARAHRLELRKVRIEVENTRKVNKQDALRYGKAVDGIANVLKFLCEPEEERLEAIEQYEERKEAARRAALAEERAAMLAAVDVDPASFNLGIMTDNSWNTIYGAAVKAKKDREESARKAEAERIKREQEEAEERARIKAENERLRAEAEAREEQLRKERAEAERKLKEQQEVARKQREAAEVQAAKERAEAEKKRRELEAIAAKERAELEAIQRREAELLRQREAAEAARKEAERRAAAAPDKEKLVALVASMRAFPLPSVSTEQAEAVLSGVRDMLSKMAEWTERKAQAL